MTEFPPKLSVLLKPATSLEDLFGRSVEVAPGLSYRRTPLSY